MGKSNPFSGLAYLNEAAYAALSFQDTIPIIESSDENAYRMTLSQLGQYIAEYSPTGDIIANTVTVIGEGTPLEVTVGSVSINGDLTLGGALNLSSSLPYSELDLTDSIVNADIATGAAIDVTKLGNGAARQLLQTNAAGDSVEWTGSIDLPGTLDVNGAATLDTSLTIAGTVTVDGVIDDDTMATASATKLSTSESIKAYVDSNAGATSMAIDGDTGSGSVNLLTQTFSIAGTANEIETSASGQTITIGLPSTITANVTGDVSGNAGTANALSSQRTFALTGDVTGSVNSDLTSGASIITAIAAGSIVNADISSSAAISVGKLSAGSLNQLLSVGATGAEWASNIDVPGTFTIGSSSSIDGIINDSSLATASATKLATSAAIKTYVDNATGSSPTLATSGDTGTGSVELLTQTLAFAGTANEIETSVSGQTVTIGLPSSITANVTGNVTGDVSGNAGTAGALSSSRTFALTGDVTGSTSSDLTSGASIATAIANLAVSKLQSGATARQLLQTNATATGVEWASNIDIPGTLDVTGVATFDGGLVGSLSGNASTSTALSSSRTFALTGDVTGSVSSNLSSGLSIATSISELPVSKLQDGTPRQLLQTDAAGTGVQWTSNVDIPGTLDVTGAATFDSGLSGTLTGNASTATSLSSNRTFALTGDVTGSVSSNLSSGMSISTAIAAGSIVNADISGSAAIALSKLATGALPTGITVASANIVNGTITDADISGSAEIAVSKLADGNPRQLLQTDAAGTGVQWTSNVDIPGTLDVTGAATFDSTISGNLSGNATTASTLQTARTISLGGDCSGSVSFNGGSNVTLTATVLDDSHNHIISNVDGLQGALDAKLNLSGGTVTGTLNVRTALDLADGDILRLGSGDDWEFFHSGGSNYMDLNDGNLYIRDNTTTRYTFERTTGNFTATGNVTAYSDRRLKEDIQIIDNALDKVKALGGYTYNRTDTGERQTGVIAQDVLAVLPEAVVESDDGYYGVAYGNMVGLLIEAIKEQQQQIEKLTALVEAK